MIHPREISEIFLERLFFMEREYFEKLYCEAICLVKVLKAILT